MISYTVRGVDRVAGAFGKLDKTVRSALVDEVRKASYLVMREEKLNLTGGNPLHVKSGRLRSSVTTEIERIKDAVLGHVGTNVVYGPTHEYGAVIRNGFGRGVVITIPKRPWVAPAYERTREKINSMFEGRITTEIVRAGL